MRRFIITGAPGAGKTAIIRQLELDGFSVVEEAATDSGHWVPRDDHSYTGGLCLLRKDGVRAGDAAGSEPGEGVGAEELSCWIAAKRVVGKASG